MAKHDQMPKYHELMNSLLKALHELGGSGSIEEISAKVSELLDLPEDVLSIPHDPEKSSQTELEYRLAWARTYLRVRSKITSHFRIPASGRLTSILNREILNVALLRLRFRSIGSTKSNPNPGANSANLFLSEPLRNME